jgi:hypothetical protein
MIAPIACGVGAGLLLFFSSCTKTQNKPETSEDHFYIKVREGSSSYEYNHGRQVTVNVTADKIEIIYYTQRDQYRFDTHSMIRYDRKTKRTYKCFGEDEKKLSPCETARNELLGTLESIQTTGELRSGIISRTKLDLDYIISQLH